MGLSNAISQDATHPRKGAVTVLHPVSCIFSADATHPRKGTKNRRKRIAPFSAAFFFCSADYLKLLSSTQRGTGALLCMKKPAPVRRGRGRRLSFPCRWSRTGPCRRPRSGWTGRPPWSRNRSSCPPFRSMDRGLSRPLLFCSVIRKGCRDGFSTGFPKIICRLTGDGRAAVRNLCFGQFCRRHSPRKGPKTAENGKFRFFCGFFCNSC